MNPERQLALEYLCPPLDGLWSWAEEGRVVVWRDGTTVGFREEFQAIVEALTPDGLPPFGALVLLLAACRGRVPEPHEVLVTSGAPTPWAAAGRAAVLHTMRRQLVVQAEAALAELRKITQLPASLVKSLPAKCVLASALLEGNRVERQANGAAVRCGWQDLERLPRPSETTPFEPTGGRLRQLHMLAEALKRYTVESLELRLRTSLAALPSPAATEALPGCTLARRLIEELSQSDALGVVGRAARELLAAVRLPRRLAQRDELALGGVADLANRGPLDRLLVTELAHDDLTLAVRLALNEALFLRREPPAREPPSTLAVLLDSGLRLWGVPRVLAVAVGLALMARERPQSRCLAWRAQGTQVVPVELLTQAGLTAHLGALETTGHPGAALSAFRALLPVGEEFTWVLVTHRETLEDPEFRRDLKAGLTGPGWIAAVDHGGRFELHAVPLSGRPPLCQATLDLEALFHPTKTGATSGAAASESQAVVSEEWPAIFGVRPFPFALPISGVVADWYSVGEDAIALLRDRRLVRIRGTSGGEILRERMPGGRIRWMGGDAEHAYLLKSSINRRPFRLVKCRLSDGEIQEFGLGSEFGLRTVLGFGNTVLLVRSGEVVAHRLGDGCLVGRVSTRLRWEHGRYFRDDRDWSFVRWDAAGGIRFHQVRFPADWTGEHIERLFDRPGREGPWALMRGGLIRSLSNAESIPLPGVPAAQSPYRVTIARDGERISVAGTPKGPWHVVELRTGTARSFPYFYEEGPLLNPAPRLPEWSVLHSVQAVAAVPDGLALRTRHGREWRIGFSSAGQLRIEGPMPLDSAPLEWVAFSREFVRPDATCTLRIATWPRGSRAWLDSRGLLHLRSGDPAVPQLSLLLSLGSMQAWTSDGCVCGPPAFLRADPAVDPARVYATLMRFRASL